MPVRRWVSKDENWTRQRAGGQRHCRHGGYQQYCPRDLRERSVGPRYGSRNLPIWLIIEDRESELCVKRPGFDEDLVVDADAEAFVKWHMGWVAWPDAVRSGHITIAGPRSLAKAFPTWNKLSTFAGVTPEASRV